MQSTADKRKNRIRKMHKVSFSTSNYSGVRRWSTGWLIECLGNNFWKVWSDAAQKYVAVHKFQMAGW